MNPDLCDDYNSVRDVILREHRLTSCAYLELFNKLTRAQGETTVMYCARLKSLLSMYVESRKVSTFDDMMSLIVCERIKSTLSENCLRHVLSVGPTILATLTDRVLVLSAVVAPHLEEARQVTAVQVKAWEVGPHNLLSRS